MQAWAPVGMHKYHSFMEYTQLYPEYDFIMVGDNGQGDAMCADRVIMKAGMSCEAGHLLLLGLCLYAGPKVTGQWSGACHVCR